MKSAIFVLCLFTSGCMSLREVIVVPPIHIAMEVGAPRKPVGENPMMTAIAKSAFGPETAVGQMAFGCGYFYQQTGRWPRTKEEVADGLAGEGLSSAKLAHLEHFNLREEGEIVTFDFISTENGRVQGTFTFEPKPKRPIS